MMITSFRAVTIGLVLAAAVPVFAQSAAPAAPAASAPAARAAMHAGLDGRHHGMRGGMFAGLSDAGRAMMRDAMKAGDPRAEHEAVKAARDRMLLVLEADRLDTAALKRAMEEERKAVQTGHDRRQAAMLTGLSKLTLEDRKAFVANARGMRARMQARVGKGYGRRDGGGRGGEMPPQPMM